MNRTEAIEVIRKCWPVNRNGMLSDALETLIPELKESEDERIRKEIYKFLIDMECKEEWIAYLEKQKEQKPFSQEVFDAAKHEALWGEQKPAEWSAEDEKKIHFLSRLIEFQVKNDEYCFSEGRFVSKQEAIEMLKSLRPSWKPSEEELVALKRVGSILRDYGYGELAKTVFIIEGKLANLSVLNKPIWKPSKEQMEALKNIAFGAYKNGDGPVLRELYEQLKEL